MITCHLSPQNEGVRGLFHGMMPRMLRRTFMAAFTWAFYEEVRIEAFQWCHDYFLLLSRLWRWWRMPLGLSRVFRALTFHTASYWCPLFSPYGVIWKCGSYTAMKNKTIEVSFVHIWGMDRFLLVCDLNFTDMKNCANFKCLPSLYLCHNEI